MLVFCRLCWCCQIQLHFGCLNFQREKHCPYSSGVLLLIAWSPCYWSQNEVSVVWKNRVKSYTWIKLIGVEEPINQCTVGGSRGDPNLPLFQFFSSPPPPHSISFHLIYINISQMKKAKRVSVPGNVFIKIMVSVNMVKAVSSINANHNDSLRKTKLHTYFSLNCIHFENATHHIIFLCRLPEMVLSNISEVNGTSHWNAQWMGKHFRPCDIDLWPWPTHLT